MSLTEPKICIDCKQLLPASCFGISKKINGSARLESCCDDCRRIRRIRSREIRLSNQRDALHLLAPGEYASKLKEQGGVCAACGGINSNGKALANDHNHATGQNRGLLCNRCNLTLGQYKDHPKIILQLAAYLTKHDSNIKD